MKAFYFNKNSGWTQAETLREALSHTHRAGLRPEDTPFEPRPEGAPFVLCLAGAGGKTSYLKQLAWEGKAAGLGPAVITTTHIYRPSSFAALDCGPEAVEQMIREQGMAVAGHLEESGKISFMGWEWYEGLCARTRLILAEADGSRRLPIKTPGPGEPVIPSNTALILCILGLSALGKPLEEVCFRLEQARTCLKMHSHPGGPLGEKWLETELGETVDEAVLECLMVHGYLEPLRKAWPRARVVPVFHQADEGEAQAAGIRMLEHMGEWEGLVSGGFLEEPSAALF